MTPQDAKGRPVKPKRRRPGERRDEAYIFLSNVRMDPASHALLKLAAAQRAIHMTTLISDVLNLWLAHAMDPKQEAVRLASAGRGPAPVPERFAGYRASLGYSIEAHLPVWTTPVPVPPEDPHGHDPDHAPRYALLPHEALRQLVNENAAIAEGNVIAGRPDFGRSAVDASRARKLDENERLSAEVDAVLLPRIGQGNAAQEYEFGPPELPGPDDYLPSHGRKV